MFVREAYALLKQSIVRVEEDDIDFDEEELAGERPGDARPHADGTQQDEDTQDQDADMEMDTEPTEPLYSGSGHATSSGHAQSSGAGEGAMDEDSQPAPQPKKRMVITHDRYMQMQSLVVLHLAQVERETGHGLDADALTDWYLELREEVIEDLDELEKEKELFGKVLRKLVKVCLVISFGLE